MITVDNIDGGKVLSRNGWPLFHIRSVARERDSALFFTHGDDPVSSVKVVPVPPGLYIHFYVKHTKKLLGIDALYKVLLFTRDNHAFPEPVQSYGPGRWVPNYRFIPHTQGFRKLPIAGTIDLISPLVFPADFHTGRLNGQQPIHMQDIFAAYNDGHLPYRNIYFLSCRDDRWSPFYGISF